MHFKKSYGKLKSILNRVKLKSKTRKFVRRNVTKEIFGGEFIALNSFMRKERSKILSVHFENVEKEE